MKLAVNDVIEVHGWVMLNNLPAGIYLISSITNDGYGRTSYNFRTLRGRLIPTRHRTEDVDLWLSDPNDPNLNKIVFLKDKTEKRKAKLMKEYLDLVEKEISPGLISNATEWVLEGWGIKDDKPSPEQLAAALFMEANTQKECVKAGESDQSYVDTLYEVGFKILELAGHKKP